MGSKLYQLPTPASTAVEVALTCKRPACGNEVLRSGGRPSVFCCKQCQTGYQRDRVEVRRRLMAAQRLAAQYEIGPDGSSLTAGPSTPGSSDRPTELNEAATPKTQKEHGTPDERTEPAQQASAYRDGSQDVVARLLLDVQLALAALGPSGQLEGAAGEAATRLARAVKEAHHALLANSRSPA